MITLDLPEDLEKHFWHVVLYNYHGDLQAAVIAFLQLHEKYGWKEQFVRDVEPIREEVHRRGGIKEKDIEDAVRKYRELQDDLVHQILRVMIETNHVMLAILSARGASAKLLDWMTRKEDYFRLLMSQPVQDEYRTAADWLIPDTKQHEKERVLHVLLTQSEWIVPVVQLDVCPDLSDNRFLECAVAGSADYLVTNNIRHFPPKEYAGVQIVRIRAFLQVLEHTARHDT